MKHRKGAKGVQGGMDVENMEKFVEASETDKKQIMRANIAERLLNYFEDQHFRTYKFFIIPKFYLKHNAYNARCLNLKASQSLCYILSSFALLVYRQNKQNQNSVNSSPFQFVRSCSEMFGKRMNLKMSVPH